MIEGLKSLDTILTTFLAKLLPHTFLFKEFFSFLSFQGVTIVVWIIALGLLIFFEERRNKRFIFYFIGSIALTITSTYIFKILIQRSRPFSPADILTGICPTDFSFPSGHTATAFAAAFMLAYFDKKRAPLYFMFAALIAYSRIYLECHFLFDVIGGIFLAYIVSLALILWYKRNSQ